jgi:hypothetical protein
MEFDPSLQELYIARRTEAGLKDFALHGRLWRFSGGLAINWQPKNTFVEVPMRNHVFLPALRDFGKLHDPSLKSFQAKVTDNTDILSAQIEPEILAEIVSSVVTSIPLEIPSEILGPKTMFHRRNFSGPVLE